MDLTLKGRHAVVCGSTQGIGKAVAVELATMGADVTLVARNMDKLIDTKDHLFNDGSQTHRCVSADFSNPEQLQHAIEVFKSNAPTVHILVNNTGGPPGGPIVSAKTDEFINAFQSHLICNHILMQAFVDGMKQEKFGRIINIISTSVKQPLKGLGVSNTIRAAVANWSKTLSLELAADGITVNNVLPGATATGRLTGILEAKSAKTGKAIAELREEMIEEIPALRFAEPWEVASAVAFLASPAAAYINGINIPVDGGRTGNL